MNMTQTTTEKTAAAKKTTKKSTKKNGAAGALLKMPGVAPDAALIEAALDHYQVERGVDVTENIAKLRAASQAVFDKDAESCVKCDRCDEFAEEVAFPKCPFCGHDGSPIAAVAAPPAAETVVLAEPVEPTSAIVADAVTNIGSADLAARTAKVKTLMLDMAGNGYDLGHELSEIHAADMWKAGGFASFKAYCADGAGVSHTLAYQLMDVATNYSRADFLSVGQTKLAIVVRAPEAERAALLDEAKKGATAQKLTQKAKAARETAKAKAAGKPAAAPPPAVAPSAEVKRGRPREEDQTIRLVAVVGGRPKQVKWTKQAGKKREETAVWTGDECFAAVPVSSTVELVVRLVLNRKKECTGVEYAYVQASE